jgi:hypothetical protein
MRPISKEPRLTNNIGAIITTDLFNQLYAHAHAHNYNNISITICNALEHYLDNADTITPPENFPSLLTPENLSRFRRDRSTNALISPKKYPHLRDRLDIFARANRLQASTVLRRAIYEHTKPATSVIATIDAWVDRPKRDTQP